MPDYIVPGSPVRMQCREGVFDLEILGDVMGGDSYRLWAWKLPPESQIVDIGAHIGGFSVLAALRVPGALIASVEMDPGNYEYLVKNTAPFGGIRTFNAACCGDDKPLGYLRGGSNSGGNRMLYTDHKLLAPMPPTMKLAEVVERAGLERIDLLKMDCEGAEFSILRAARADGTLAKVSRIAAEYHEFHEGDTLAVLRELLAAEGFVMETHPIDSSPGYSISGIIYARRKRGARP